MTPRNWSRRNNPCRIQKTLSTQLVKFIIDKLIYTTVQTWLTSNNLWPPDCKHQGTLGLRAPVPAPDFWNRLSPMDYQNSDHHPKSSAPSDIYLGSEWFGVLRIEFDVFNVWLIDLNVGNWCRIWIMGRI